MLGLASLMAEGTFVVFQGEKQGVRGLEGLS